jgi:serine/threonine-protein kinase
VFGVLNDDVVGWDGAQVVAQSLKTGQRKVLLNGGVQAKYLSSGHLVYARAGSLLAVPFDLDRLETSGEATVVVEGVGHPGDGGAALFNVTRDGILAYVGAAADGGRSRLLVWVDRAGREQPLALEPRFYVQPRISPDGTRVAMSVEQDLNIDVRVYDLERATLIRRLTTFLGHDWSPSWTPDGARVFYVSDIDGGVLFWRDADGTGEGRVVDKWRAPQSWSPDGAFLTFIETNPDTGRDIGVLSLADDTASELLVTEFAEDSPAVSPDGRFVAFSSTESDQSEVYVSPFPDVAENRWQISRDGGAYPAWSPDGTELFFLNDGAMMAAGIHHDPIFAWDEPKILFDGDYIVRGNFGRPYDVAADGQRFLMMKNVDSTPRRDIHVVLNWVAELERLVPTEN